MHSTSRHGAWMEAVAWERRQAKLQTKADKRNLKNLQRPRRMKSRRR